jgi:hypothetical protein
MKLGDPFMTEMNTSTSDNTQPSQTGGNQTETVGEVSSFHPVRLSDNNGNLHEKEENMQELMRNINEESSRLSEFLATENKLMIEICTSLAQVLKKLSVSFDIPSRDLPLQEKVKKAILNEEGYLRLFSEKGEVNSAFLAEYSPETVMAVLWVVMPELTKAMASQRKKVSKRISLFEAMKKELKNVVKTIVGASEESKSLQTGTQSNTLNDSSGKQS